MSEFRMPSLGADMESGKLVEWRVQPGDRVRRGDIIAAVETEKGVIDVEIFEDGVVERFLAEPGQKLPVGAPMATIRSGETASASVPAGEPAEAAAPHTGPAAAVEPARASPLARRRARELGIDLANVQGSGPGGAVELADVEAAAAQRAPAAGVETPAAPSMAPAASQPMPPSGSPEGMRRVIASAMARSNREIPHYYLETAIDMSRALGWLEEANRQRPVERRLLPAALLYKAVALSLTDVPELNGSWIDDRHVIHEHVHLGIAISLRGGGLVVPAIHDAEVKSLDEMMDAMRDVITRARSARLRSSELSDATVTVTHLGDLGVRTVFGVIYPPQVALVGFGKITEQAWVSDGRVEARPVLVGTLAADHRATDGRRGAQFLETLGRRLEAPETL